MSSARDPVPKTMTAPEVVLEGDNDEEDLEGNNKHAEEGAAARRGDEATGTAVAEDDDEVGADVTGMSAKQAEAVAEGKPAWALVEEQVLRTAVTAYRGKNWDQIARFLPERSEAECRARWRIMCNFPVPAATKGPWTAAEDEKLRQVVAMHGPQNWSSFVATYFQNRTGKQCRERWRNNLDPELKRGPWTEEEERVLLETHQRVGNRWSLIARKLPGRSDNDVKNHWYASQRRLKTRMQLVNVVYAGQDGHDVGDGNNLDVDDPLTAASGPASASKRPREAMESRLDAGADEDDLLDGGLRKAPRVGGASSKVTGLTAADGPVPRSFAALDPTDSRDGEGPPAPSVSGDLSGDHHETHLVRWDAEEGAKLLELVTTYGTSDWNAIADHMPRRTALQCSRHWNNVLNPNIVKGRGSWTPAEDAKLRKLVERWGPAKWTIQIAPHLPGRMGKQCRERWFNALQPNLRRGGWTDHEERIFDEEHQRLGNQWAFIARKLPGRSANDVKNHYYASQRRRDRQDAKAKMLSSINNPAPPSDDPNPAGDPSPAVLTDSAATAQDPVLSVPAGSGGTFVAFGGDSGSSSAQPSSSSSSSSLS